MNSTELQALKIIEFNRSKILNAGLSVSDLQRQDYNYEFIVSDRKDRCKILSYFGKKGVKTDIQGNSESKLYSIVNEIIHGIELFNSIKDEIDEPASYIGTDESGKGDFFGPLVVAGVYAHGDILVQLKQIGVKDSKLISDNEIQTLSASIRRLIKDDYDIIVINPEKYNRLYASFGNLNKILAWAHAKVIENLLTRINTAQVISDKFGDEKLIKNSLQSRGKEVNLMQVTKAERYTAVAAASILARYKFNEWFYIQKKKFKHEIPKGASDAVVSSAERLTDELGSDQLHKFVKIHFKTMKKLNIDKIG